DAGWHLSEWVMAAMLVVIVVAMIPVAELSLWSMAALWVYILVAVGDLVLLANRVKRKAAAKFGADRREKGLGWYAAMRSLQMRFMRLPKPQVKRGQYPS